MNNCAQSSPDNVHLLLSSDWMSAHRELTRLAAARSALDFEAGRWLVVAWRTRVHEKLGFSSFAEYLHRIFGWTARLCRDKLQVAEALDGLPELSRLLRDGMLVWSA